MTTKREVEFTDDHASAESAIDAIVDGKGWCNLTPEVSSDDVAQLTVNILALRIKKGAPVATYVSEPQRRGAAQAGTLGVLHTRGRLGKEHIVALLGGAPFAIKQDHNQRGLLLEVPAATSARVVLDTMCSLLAGLCDYDRTGRWRLMVYERA